MGLTGLVALIVVVAAIAIATAASVVPMDTLPPDLAAVMLGVSSSWFWLIWLWSKFAR